MEKSQSSAKVPDSKSAFLNQSVTIASNLYPFPAVSLSTAHIVQETGEACSGVLSLLWGSMWNQSCTLYQLQTQLHK